MNNEGKRMIVKKLDEMLEVECKQNKDKHITYLRKVVLEKAKKKGLIKDFKYLMCYDYNKRCNYWGSRAGYDTIYYIKFNL